MKNAGIEKGGVRADGYNLIKRLAHDGKERMLGAKGQV